MFHCAGVLQNLCTLDIEFLNRNMTQACFLSSEQKSNPENKEYFSREAVMSTVI